MARLRDRVVETIGSRSDLTLFRLDRPTEITCVRFMVRSTTRWVAVLQGDRAKLWCTSCFLAMPAG